MNKSRIKLMCISGVFVAVVFIFTAYLHIPVNTGYIHVGDPFIYVAACLLPLPFAVFVGAAGAMLADCLTGFAVWAIGSMIIKSAAVLCFSRNKKMISARNVIALIFSSLICVGGYYIYEVKLTGNFIAPVAGILGNTIQSVASCILFILLSLLIDNSRLKNFLKDN